MMKTTTRHGIAILDSDCLRQAKKDQAMFKTGLIMEKTGLYRGITHYDDLDTIRTHFHALSPEQKLFVLQRQREDMINAIHTVVEEQPYKLPNHVKEDNPLRWSFIRDRLFGGLYKSQKILSSYKTTSHSYNNPTLQELFEDQDRLYIPMDQFTHRLHARDTPMTPQFLVLSRHPYDLVRSATARQWTNCMSYDAANFSYYVGRDIARGTIAAYGVQSANIDWRNTDWNLSNPTNRRLMKPYVESKGTLAYKPDTIFGPRDDASMLFNLASKEVCRNLLCREAVAGRRYRMDGLYETGAIPSAFVMNEADMATHPLKPGPTKSLPLLDRVQNTLWDLKQYLRNDLVPVQMRF